MEKKRLFLIKENNFRLKFHTTKEIESKLLLQATNHDKSVPHFQFSSPFTTTTKSVYQSQTDKGVVSAVVERAQV